MDDKIVVTGGAGFIGSNIVKGLNRRGYTNLIVVDNLGNNSGKFSNLVDCEIADFIDKQAFLPMVNSGYLGEGVRAVFHQGACSDTMELDGQYMMANNYDYSKSLLEACQQAALPFIYASSASVYGGGKVFAERRTNEAPLNVYGYSKFLFDQYVRRHRSRFTTQVVGFRYFNVYGPGEQHKGRMASVSFHFFNQFNAQGYVNLFKGSDGYGDGCQLRDFIYVDDVVAANLHCLDQPQIRGIFNLGTGQASTFNDVALAVVNYCRGKTGTGPLTLESAVEQELEPSIDFPQGLRARDQ
ncbi:MAG: ADP-glyceromanno-heptose 6-epimerase, partial [Gammaproteobacteria bacterium]